ncbi:phasin family protein [Sphingomonas sp.]|uniref:phasin family protein n=1 Tax=Sphingomonas sp. TaxID=28214 RepID=UPI00286D94FA|nr:phasin family protein [Sphingomonas sp.]
MQQFMENTEMADITNTQAAQAAADAPAKLANTVAATTVKIAKDGEKAAKRARASTARRIKRQAKAATAKTATTTRRAKKTVRRAKRTVRATVAAATPRTERKSTMNFDTNNWFAGLTATPTAAPFQSLFADAGERSQEAVKKSQKVASELADLTRANVEALTEAGRIAAEGVRSIGQDVVANGRDGIEKAADAVRSLAEAKSPTEFVQIQNELARTSFDRMVAETSRLTESMVKLAGEAFQPLSNRASITAERVNQFVA